MHSPQNAKQTGRDALLILGLALAMCLLYATLCRTLRWHADFAESNFQSNLLRIENYLFGMKPDAVLAGSSITGRLLPKYFAEKGWNVANLGLDGSGTGLGLEIVRRRPDAPPWVFAEINSLLRPPNHNDDLLRAAMADPSFVLARNISICRSELRPSALLYSAFKSSNDRRISQRGVAAAPSGEPAPSAEISPPSVPAQESRPAGLNSIKDDLAALQSGGVKVIFLRVPAGGPPPPTRSPDLADQIAAELKSRQIEAITLTDGEAMIFTDGLHLASKSAETVSHAIVKQLPPK